MPLLDPRSGPSYGAIEQEHDRDRDTHRSQEQDQERDRLLQDEYLYQTDGEDSEISSLDEAQEGVRKIEAINMTWTTRSLIIAYVRFVWLAASCL
jgi:hypothetical protein